MFKKTSLTALALGIGLVAGLALSHIPTLRTVYAQNSGKLLVKGDGRAISSVTPPTASEQFTLIPSNAPRSSFRVVPAGKKFVLTDVMYMPQQSVRQNLVVNISDASPATQTHSILFQVKLSPGESHQVHLTSGYVIPAGNALIAFTNAGLAPQQFISISVTGYLVDE